MKRRTFVRNGTLFLAAGASVPDLLAAGADKPLARIGIVTDLHHAEKPARGSRHYRESFGKLEEAGRAFAKAAPEHVVELGDFIDSADSIPAEKRHLRSVQKKFTELPGIKHHVLGNHCVHTLTKREFLDEVERPRSYYSFDHAGHHFVVLDSCFRGDGVAYQRKNFVWTDPNVPAEELEWLAADLKSAKTPTIILAHQRLDVTDNHGVKNAAAVRKILENSQRVRAVFQGHSHQNDHKEINGIHYTTIVAMVEGTGAENNGYAILNILGNGGLSLTGFRKQVDRKLS
ncbi:MAG: putative phosphodiesterase [Limisphaerales bacterium]|jgi:predicted phosphodiesterase